MCIYCSATHTEFLTHTLVSKARFSELKSDWLSAEKSIVRASVREDNPRASVYCTIMHLHLVHYEIIEVKLWYCAIKGIFGSHALAER